MQVKIVAKDRLGGTASAEVTVVATWPSFIDGLPPDQYSTL
jgi:hypothetical protein